MTSNGFDPASDARFRATVEIEIKHVHKQIDLLWQHNHKRRAEIVAARKQLSRDIAAIEGRINGAVYAVAAAALAGLWVFIKPHLGF